MKNVLSLVLIASTIATCSPESAANLVSTMSAGEHQRLRAFLRVYLRNAPYDYHDTRYIAAKVSLSKNVSGTIVYFTDRKSCGSSGCTTLILARSHGSYRLVTSIPAAWRPIRILDSATFGWHDIAVWVQGGGIQPGYEAVIQFDGITYQRSPSVPPARHAEDPNGEIAIGIDSLDQLLF